MMPKLAEGDRARAGRAFGRRPAKAIRGSRGFTLIEIIGALVVFSAGVLMLLGLTGVLTMQLGLAAERSAVAVEVQDRLDSLRSVPYDSLLPGTYSDTIVLRGRAFLRTQTVLQATPMVREIQVTVKPADGPGPETTVSSFVQRQWQPPIP